MHVRIEHTTQKRIIQILQSEQGLLLSLSLSLGMAGIGVSWEAQRSIVLGTLDFSIPLPCKTNLSLYIICNKSKNHIFIVLGLRGKPLENFTFDLDVLKSILLGEDEEQWILNSYTPKILYPMTRTMILALQSVGFGKDDLLIFTISLFL